MRKSILLTNDFPPVISGISTVFYNVWKYYDPAKTVVLTPYAHGWKEFDSSAGVKPLRYGTFLSGGAGKIVGMIRASLKILTTILKDGVSEIHAGQILSSGPIGYFFQIMFHIPCFLWVYGGETTKVYQRSMCEKKLVDFLLRESRYLVTNSPAVTEEFLNYGIPEERIIEIIPAVDPDFFTPGDEDALAGELGIKGKKVLLTVSRLTPRKGHDLVLKAIKEIGDKHDLHYVIVGGGEDKERLMQMANDLGISERITFTGKVSDERLPAYYRLCDVYVMPNREIAGSTDSVEGFGISFIEANACGKPSIAGRSGGTGEAVSEGVSGYIVNPEDPAELVQKLDYLFENPDVRGKMGKDGRERVISGYTWKSRAEKLAKFSFGDLVIK